MSKIFGTLAAVLLAAAALVAYKNKEAKAEEIVTMNTSKKLEVSRTKEFNKQTKRRNDAEALRDEHNKNAEVVENELEKLNMAYQDAKKEVEALKKDHALKEQEIANADEILKELPDPKELVPKIKRMRSQLAEAKTSIESETSRLANLVELDKGGKARLKTTRQLIGWQSSGQSFPTMKTRITSVYRNWGFVILGAGDTEGVVTGSTLDVLRDGEVVAKLRVTAVEGGRASADVVLDSVAEGVKLRVGDAVVAEKKPEATTAAK